MLSMLLILACTNAGADGKTSPEIRLRFVAESLTTPGYSEPFSTEARIDETAKTITVFIPEFDENSQPTDDTSISLRVDLTMGYEFELTDAGGAQHTSSDQDTPVSLPMVDLSDSGSFAVTQAGNSVTYTVSTFKGIPIFTEDELRGIQNIQDGMNKNYFLMNDIALLTDFVPLGSVTAHLSGIFDGRGKTISNLKIVRSGEDYVGFFKSIGYNSNHSNYNENSNGEVRYLILALADSSETSPTSIEGRSYVGAVAGQNYGKIDSVRVTGGVIKGTATYLGGLVGGQIDGIIENSYATGRVDGTHHIGGLAGSLQGGEIKNSYATGDVKGRGFLGGLVGWLNSGEIKNSYATGAVMGESEIGGLVGLQTTGTTITSSFFDANLTRQDEGIGNKPNSGVVTAFYTVDGVVRKDNNATADAVTRDDFVGWNFNGGPAENNGNPIWRLPADGGEWPILSWQDPQNQ